MRRLLRATGTIVAGSVLVVAGIAMLVLPGPGLVTIVLGLILLSEEIPWVRRRVNRLYDRLPVGVRSRVPAAVARRLSTPLDPSTP